jgi:hypothetical protein
MIFSLAAGGEAWCGGGLSPAVGSVHNCAKPVFWFGFGRLS